MTLIAIFADIHSNREALDACLAEARAKGAEGFVFLGDLVGYGADPGYIIDLAARFKAEGTIVIKGNHDAAIGEIFDSMNSYAREARDWTRKQLSKAQKDFLAGLPLTAESGETLFVHAEASHPRDWIYVTRPIEAERSLHATKRRVTICGHVHRPQLYRQAEGQRPVSETPAEREPILLAPEFKWLAVLGSVGQPRDEKPAAAFSLYDDERAVLTLLRVPYDVAAAAQKIRAAGLPEILAARLYFGR